MFFFRLLSRLPMWALFCLSDLLFFITYYLIRYRKKVVWVNLKNSFPDKTDMELRKIQKGFYRNLTDVIVETLKSVSISKEEINKRVVYRNFEEMNHFLTKGQTLVGMAAHQCNWEWLLIGTQAILADATAEAIYKPLSNGFFEKLMLTIRSKFGAYPIPMQKLPRELVSRRKITRIISLVSDQAAAPESAYWTTFLHQDTAFFTGGAKIALSSNFPILYFEMKRVKRGYYEINVKLIGTPPYTPESVIEITEKYMKLLEKTIQENPSDWLWSHKRWKHKKDF